MDSQVSQGVKDSMEKAGQLPASKPSTAIPVGSSDLPLLNRLVEEGLDQFLSLLCFFDGKIFQVDEQKNHHLFGFDMKGELCG